MLVASEPWWLSLSVAREGWVRGCQSLSQNRRQIETPISAIWMGRQGENKIAGENHRHSSGHTLTETRVYDLYDW